jgi:hypothetical protein
MKLADGLAARAADAADCVLSAPGGGYGRGRMRG